MNLSPERPGRRAGAISIAWIGSFAALTLFAGAAVAQPGGRQVWVVGGGGADFADIPPAIAAAAEGDLILVRTGIYSAFTLDKGVHVRAAASPFLIDAATPEIVVENIAAGRQAAISGMLLSQNAFLPASDWRLTLRNCAGEVILEHVTINGIGTPTAARNLRLDITDCANVAATDLTVLDGSAPSWSEIGPAFTITRSSVRISAFTGSGAHGQDGGSSMFPGPADGSPGGGALLVTSSSVTLAGASVTGGNGGQGTKVTDSTGTHLGNGGHGGHALELVDAQVVILGLKSQVLRGGNGGNPYANGFRHGVGGNGGDGVCVVGSGSAVISRTTAHGSTGGTYGGQAGLPLRGNATRDDRYPYLTVTGDLNLGQRATIQVNAIEPGFVLLVVADRGGQVPLRNYAGAPLSVLGGTYYRFLPLGSADGAGLLTFDVTVPADPTVRGFTGQMQAAVFGGSGSYLSNPVQRIVGE